MNHLKLPPREKINSPSLPDILLYLLSKEVQENKPDELKIRMADVYKVLAPLQDKIRNSNIPIKFERVGSDTYSRQVDDALYYLIPQDVEIVNPSFSIKLTKARAISRMKHLESKLTPHAISKLSKMHDTFHTEIGKLALPTTH